MCCGSPEYKSNSQSSKTTCRDLILRIPLIVKLHAAVERMYVCEAMPIPCITWRPIAMFWHHCHSEDDELRHAVHWTVSLKLPRSPHSSREVPSPKPWSQSCRYHKVIILVSTSKALCSQQSYPHQSTPNYSFFLISFHPNPHAHTNANPPNPIPKIHHRAHSLAVRPQHPGQLLRRHQRPDHARLAREHGVGADARRVLRDRWVQAVVEDGLRQRQEDRGAEVLT